MPIETTFKSQVKTVEELANNEESLSAANNTVTHDAFDTTVTMNAGSTPPATKTANFIQALSAGAATIDLTALVGTNGKIVDGTGLKVQLFKVKNLGANPLTVKFGAATAYLLAGAAWKMILNQDQEITFYGNDSAPDISGTLKHIDLAGTGVETCEVSIVMG